MKKIKLLCVPLLCAALALTLSSCNMIGIFGELGITSPATGAASQTAAPGGSQTSADTAAPTPTEMNIDALDLTKYMTLEYKGLDLTVTELPTAPTPEEIEGELSALLLYYEKYTLITDRAAAEGDYIEMSYSGTVDGQPLSGGQSDKATILLDDANSGYIPGFAAGLIGAMPGSTVTLHLTFPENYYAEIAGKAVDFDVTVKGICSFELTDAIASELSSGSYPTAAAYREHLGNYLREAKDYAAFAECYETIWNLLAERADIIVYPADQVDYYYQTYVAFVLESAAYYGVDYDTYLTYIGETDESLRENAREDTKYDMILYYVAHAENLTMTDDEYRAYLKKMVEANNNAVTAEYIEQYYEANYGKGYLRTMAFREMVGLRVYQLSNVTKAPAAQQ